MSDPDFEIDGPETVEDEEGRVARKLKDSILNVRERVDEREDKLFVGRVIDDDIERNISYEQALDAWGNTVRQYIRKIRPILMNDDVQNAKEYRESKTIGTYTMHPPDKEPYRFSKLTRDGIDADRLMRSWGLPPNQDPPQPKVFEFEGLLSILAKQRLRHAWQVTINDSGPPPKHETMLLEKSEPIPKSILENAVVQADMFLQDADLGLKIGSGRDMAYYG